MNSIRKGDLILEAELTPEARGKLVSTLLRIYRSHTPDQIMALISKPKPLTLVKGVEEPKARKFIEMLQAQGIVLHFVPSGQIAPEPHLSTQTRLSDVSPQPAQHSPAVHRDASPPDTQVSSPAPPPRRDQKPGSKAPPARERKRGSPITKTILLLIFLLLVGFYASWQLGLLSMPRYEPVVLDKYGYPEETVSRIEVRQLFEQKEYDKLNELIGGAQEAFESDFRNEFLIHDAVMAFHQPVPEYEEIFREWTTAFPDHYQPYLARGHYYWNMGTTSRGAAWAKDTTKEQFAGMEEYFRRAFEDLYHALEINPKLMTAYYALLAMSNFTGQEDLEKEYFQKCLSICEECYQPRYFYMMALRPKWGGSIREMNELAGQSQRYADRNPLLKTLQGFPYMSLGESRERRKRHISAMKNYNKSLAYGSNYTLLQERAEFLLWQKKYGHALQDIDMAIAMRGQVSYAWRTKAFIQFGLTNYEDALESLTHARELAPTDVDVRKAWDWMARSYMEIGRYNMERQSPVAIRCFKLACEMQPDNAEAYWQLGLVYLKIGELEKAREPIERACELGMGEACSRL